MTYTRFLETDADYPNVYGRYVETENGFREITDEEWEQYEWIDVTCHHHPVQKVFMRDKLKLANSHDNETSSSTLL